MHVCADPVPALPEPIFPSHILGYLGSSLRGSRDLDSDVAGRNGGLALPFSKEEDRYDHNLKRWEHPASGYASRLRLITMSALQVFLPAVSPDTKALLNLLQTSAGCKEPGQDLC